MLSSMNENGNKNTTLSSSVKKQNAWISSSFDSFGDFGQDQSVTSSRAPARNSRKRPREAVSQPQRSYPGKLQPATNCSPLEEDELWSARHKPRSQADLAVHKKKIAEVQAWLQDHVYKKRGLAPLLLLTGPPGCGKTATIQVLTREMAVEVQEWTNPATGTYSVAEWSYEARELAVVGGPLSESQSTQFQDFLLRANKYPTLQIFHQEQLHRKVILVEEMPNAFFKDTKQFHDILRRYQRHGRCPLVFIVSDSAGGESNERLLFPKDMQSELNITNISFNPVAQTSMVKTLTLIASQEVSKGCGRFSMPDRSVIEALATSSSGDIRGAINALHFACLKGRLKP
ncbi:hypothetical protein NP493_109g05020 [Ridgeia piscesae]|uniref:Cell cycle checkpoint protein RAD17 n=1 Tax=Ridgeia piscesae TaxID=27915 RepID=A0AAD9P712_RIDPI|nr:hypothetical protein NP493_109g05020 [Ridgeia piscesae]